MGIGMFGSFGIHLNIPGWVRALFPKPQKPAPKPISQVSSPIQEDPKPAPLPEESVSAPVQDPVPDEPVPEELVSEEPVKEEPVSQEPVPDEPVSEEPVSQEPVPDEPVSEENVSEELVSEEPVKEEQVKEEPIFQEPVKDPFQEPLVEGSLVEESGSSIPDRTVPFEKPRSHHRKRHHEDIFEPTFVNTHHFRHKKH